MKRFAIILVVLLSPLFMRGQDVNDATDIKVDYGKPDGRACFRWDYPVDPESATPYELIRVLDLPATDCLGCTIKFGAKAGIEVAGVLLMPYPSDDFRCDLLKLLCGVNFEPWRVCSGLVCQEKGNAQ